MYPRAGEGTAWRVLQRDRLADLNHQYAQVTYDDTVFGTHKKSGGSRVRYDPAEVPSLGGFDDEGSGNRVTGEEPAVRRLR
jgi:hypothetical protein